MDDEDDSQGDNDAEKPADEMSGDASQARSEDLSKLRQLLEDDDDLNARTDDEFLLRFLRFHAHSPKQAMVMIQRYYRMKVTEKDLFTNLLPSELDDVFTSNLVGVLPERDSEGRFVMVVRAGAWDTRKFTFVQVFRGILLCFEYMSLSPRAQQHGVNMLCDFEGWGYTTALSIPSTRMRAIAGTLTNTYPVKQKKVHVVKQPYSFNLFYNMITPFLSQEAHNRVHLHGSDLKALHKSVPRDILPREFGGKKGRFSAADFYEHLREKEPQFAEDFGFGYETE